VWGGVNLLAIVELTRWTVEAEDVGLTILLNWAGVLFCSVDLNVKSVVNEGADHGCGVCP